MAIFLRDARTLSAVIRHPDRALPAFLAQPHSPHELVRNIVLPWCAIRPLATLLRAAWMQSLAAGAVLAVGAGLLGVGTWAALALMLPGLCRPFKLHLPERHALVVATVICAPLWGASILLGVPDEPPALFIISRALVLGLASYGIALLHRILRLLQVPRAATVPLLASVAGAYVAIYLLTYAVVGIIAHLVLWLMGH